MSRHRLDWSDPVEVRLFVGDMRTALDDIDAIVVDMMRAPRDRELGPVLARDGYQDARGKVVALLSWIEPAPASEPDAKR